MFEQVKLYDVLSNLGIIASFISLIAGVLIFSRSEYGFKAMVCLAFVALATDLTLTFASDELVGAIVSRTYSLLEFVLISTFFYAQFKNGAVRYLIIAGVALFPLIVIIDAVTSSHKLRDDLVTVCEAIILVTYSVSLLYKWMKNIEYESITAAPQFWLVSAILLYFGGNIFVFSSSNYAYSVSHDVFDFVWTIHAAIGLIYYVTITFGFWKARKAYQ